jgi:hypothetical protein
VLVAAPPAAAVHHEDHRCAGFDLRRQPDVETLQRVAAIADVAQHAHTRRHGCRCARAAVVHLICFLLLFVLRAALHDAVAQQAGRCGMQGGQQHECEQSMSCCLHRNLPWVVAR